MGSAMIWYTNSKSGPTVTRCDQCENWCHQKFGQVCSFKLCDFKSQQFEVTVAEWGLSHP